MERLGIDEAGFLQIGCPDFCAHEVAVRMSNCCGHEGHMLKTDILLLKGKTNVK